MLITLRASKQEGSELLSERPVSNHISITEPECYHVHLNLVTLQHYIFAFL